MVLYSMGIQDLYSLLPCAANEHLLAQPLTSIGDAVRRLADMKCSGDVAEAHVTAYTELE